jgi:hypothetical protein
MPTYHRTQAGEPSGDHLDISRQDRQSCDSFNELKHTMSKNSPKAWTENVEGRWRRRVYKEGRREKRQVKKGWRCYEQKRTQVTLAAVL